MGKNSHGAKHRVRVEGAVAARLAAEKEAADAEAAAAAAAAPPPSADDGEPADPAATAAADAALKLAEAENMDAAREARRLDKKEIRRRRLAAEEAEREKAVAEGRQAPLSAKEQRRAERKAAAEAAAAAKTQRLEDRAAKVREHAERPKVAPEPAAAPAAAVAEAAAAAPPVPDTSAFRIFVGGIPFAFSVEDIAALFEPHGGVSSVEPLMHPDSGHTRFRGMAFVELCDERSFHACLALNGLDVEGGFVLSVKRAKSRAAMAALAEAGGQTVATAFGGKPAAAAAVVPSAPLPLDAASCVLYVGNLSPAVDEEALGGAFEGLPLASVSWGFDRATGEFRGFAHVAFGSLEEAERALLLDGTQLLGRPMRVAREAKRLKPRSAEAEAAAAAAAAGTEEKAAVAAPSAAAGGKAEGGVRAYVTGLPYHAAPEAVLAGLRELFETQLGCTLGEGERALRLGFGPPEKDVGGVAPPARGPFLGYAHVDFASPESLEKAVAGAAAGEGARVLGKPVRVAFAADKPGKVAYTGPAGRGGRKGGRGGRERGASRDAKRPRK